MTPKIVVLLPMKANFQRVSNNNTKDFFWESLYRRALKLLLKHKYIEKFIINTDSEIIKEDVKSSFGEKIIIHDRPGTIQGNHVSMNKVF
jgi:CMP-N-acetylneuraminic acid synthetase